MIWYTLLVVAVGLERLAELVVSKRNAAWSLAHGGVETGQRHYVVMVVLHTGLLVGCLVEVWWRRPDVRPGTRRSRCSRSCWRRRRCGGGASRRSATSGTPG